MCLGPGLQACTREKWKWVSLSGKSPAAGSEQAREGAAGAVPRWGMGGAAAAQPLGHTVGQVHTFLAPLPSLCVCFILKLSLST